MKPTKDFIETWKNLTEEQKLLYAFGATEQYALSKRKEKKMSWLSYVRIILNGAPMIMLALITMKISESCIDITNKAYMLLIVVAIYTYWTFKNNEENRQ